MGYTYDFLGDRVFRHLLADLVRQHFGWMVSGWTFSLRMGWTDAGIGLEWALPTTSIVCILTLYPFFHSATHRHVEKVDAIGGERRVLHFGLITSQIIGENINKLKRGMRNQTATGLFKAS